jgi:hypothetical protein
VNGVLAEEHFVVAGDLAERLERRRRLADVRLSARRGVDRGDRAWVLGLNIELDWFVKNRGFSRKM